MNHIVARRVGHRTVLSSARASSPLKFVAPSFGDRSSTAMCLVTLGGGLVDGDSIDVDVTVEPGATLVLFTQATTKVFRGASRQSLRAQVHGTLVWLPDPVACFRGARYTQDVDVTLHGEGSCVLLDGFTSGRAAFGDRWAFDALTTRTTISLANLGADRAIVRDALRLDVRDGDVSERMDRFEAMATLFVVGPRVRPLFEPVMTPAHAEDAEDADGSRVVAAPSRLPKPVGLDSTNEAPSAGAMVRIAGTNPTEVLDEVRSRLRNLPEIDVVDPFSARK